MWQQQQKSLIFYVGFNMFMAPKAISLTDVEAMGDHDPIVPEISYADNRLPHSILYKNIFVP